MLDTQCRFFNYMFALIFTTVVIIDYHFVNIRFGYFYFNCVSKLLEYNNNISMHILWKLQVGSVTSKAEVDEKFWL